MASKTKKASPFDGALIIDKPAGMTSHDVVSRLRRILNTKKIGHTGTLDPFATGVLVMLVGKATRLARFLDKDAKSYEAVVSFGFETDTGDREGVRREFRRQESGVRTDRGSEQESEPPSVAGGDISECSVGRKELRNEQIADGSSAMIEAKTSVENRKSAESEEQQVVADLPSKSDLIERVNAVLPSFTGTGRQIPPMYSAKKVKGKKLYELARQGIEIEREPVNITISELTVHRQTTPGVYSEKTGKHPNEIVLRVSCSAGTYIRTLAEDIGRKVGIGCHLSELRRTTVGRFDLEDAMTLEELERLAEAAEVESKVVSMSAVVGHLPAQTLDKEELRRVSSGLKIDARFEADSVLEARLTDAADELVAIGQTDREGKIQPKIVFISS